MSDKSNDHASWDASSMIKNAKSLQRVAKELEKNSSEALESDRWLFHGNFLASPILLSLATEIALKAWWCREQNEAPKRTHDLLKLFEVLRQDTQEMLEAKMRKSSPYSVWAAEPNMQNLSPDLQDMLGVRMHPLRDVLCAHRDANMHWRFLYEKTGALFETAEIDRALTVLIDAYHEKMD